MPRNTIEQTCKTRTRSERCAFCCERKTVQGESWQQWQCAACGSWNDKAEPNLTIEDRGRAASREAEKA